MHTRFSSSQLILSVMAMRSSGGMVDASEGAAIERERRATAANGVTTRLAALRSKRGAASFQTERLHFGLHLRPPPGPRVGDSCAALAPPCNYTGPLLPTGAALYFS